MQLEAIMKLKSCVTAIATLGVLCSSVFAEGTAPLTHEQVRQDLIKLEQTGYRPGSASNINYPDDLQAAEKQVVSTAIAEGVAPNAPAEPTETVEFDSLASKSSGATTVSAIQTGK
jgi:hypothetical protein